MIHIERVHWMSETPLSTAQAQRLSQQFGHALEKAVVEMRGATQDWSFGTLTVHLPQQAAAHPNLLAQVATQTAQQLMQRVGEAAHKGGTP